MPGWTDELSQRVGNIELSRLMGADVRLDPGGFDIGIRSSWEKALSEVETAGGKPYPIPAGASEHKFGGLGFVNWAFEVAEQERELGVFFDTIIVCTVTGSTQAGMISGFAALEDAGGRPRRVLGIDASATIEKTRALVRRIAQDTSDLIGLGRPLRDDEVVVLEGWAGDYHGVPVESTIEAIRLAARLEGFITDPVYEGKSMAGLIDLVGAGEIGADSTVLYAHLGGQLATQRLRGSLRVSRFDAMDETQQFETSTQQDPPSMRSRPLYAGATLDASVLDEVAQRVLWLSTAMVDAANAGRPSVDGVKVGGHQASSASMVGLMTALWFTQLTRFDRVSVKPHASPVLHAINYLLGDLDEHYLPL